VFSICVALLFASCNTDVSGDPGIYTVSYSIKGKGTVIVKLEGKTFVSGNTVENGRVLEFTANPGLGYRVVWRPEFVVSPSNKNKASLTVTKEMNVLIGFDVVPKGEDPSEWWMDKNGTINYYGTKIDKLDGVVVVPCETVGLVEMTDDSSWNGFVRAEGAPFLKGVFPKDRKVKLSPFVMSKYEVTQKLYNTIKNVGFNGTIKNIHRSLIIQIPKIFIIIGLKVSPIPLIAPDKTSPITYIKYNGASKCIICEVNSTMFLSFIKKWASGLFHIYRIKLIIKIAIIAINKATTIPILAL